MTQIKKIEGFTPLTKREVLNACSHTSGLVPNFLHTDGKEYVRLELCLAAMSEYASLRTTELEKRVKELEEGLRGFVETMPDTLGREAAFMKAKQLINHL